MYLKITHFSWISTFLKIPYVDFQLYERSPMVNFNFVYKWLFYIVFPPKGGVFLSKNEKSIQIDAFLKLALCDFSTF